MPIQSYCDNCGNRTTSNAAVAPINIVRERLEIAITVVHFNSTTNPIICNKCVRLVAQHGEEHRDES